LTRSRATLALGTVGYEARRPRASLVRIFVTEEAFEAIKATLPVGTVAFELEVTKGLRSVWVEQAVVDKLARMRRPDETFSHVIMRLAAGERG
jgi:hypothetical protein